MVLSLDFLPICNSPSTQSLQQWLFSVSENGDAHLLNCKYAICLQDLLYTNCLFSSSAFPLNFKAWDAKGFLWAYLFLWVLPLLKKITHSDLGEEWHHCKSTDGTAKRAPQLWQLFSQRRHYRFVFLKAETRNLPFPLLLYLLENQENRSSAPCIKVQKLI